MKPVNLFYEEPDPDRWLPLDRFPRRVIRRLIHGRKNIGGQQRVFLNLCAGLEDLEVPYRVNDYGYITQHPDQVACIIGKPHVLDRLLWSNPILFGAAVHSHPVEDPQLLNRLPVRKILVPGEWMRQMYEPYYGNAVTAWPVGIDTKQWKPPEGPKTTDFLIYDKVRWRHDEFEHSLILPIRAELTHRKLSFETIKYGAYREEAFEEALGRCRAMIFLCEHETQGIAYQQALSAGVPILAWDRGGYWQDPAYYPHRVKFEPVTSVPYWDSRCGVKFANAHEFPSALSEILDGRATNRFAPRQYILENLTLEQCARAYLQILTSVSDSTLPTGKTARN